MQYELKYCGHTSSEKPKQKTIHSMKVYVCPTCGYYNSDFNKIR